MKKINKNFIIGILIVIFSFTIFTFARYVIEEYHSYYMNTRNFYFTSNRLKRDNPVYLVNNWSGVGNFNISFDLLSEKNSLVHSEYDIPYEVSFICPSDVICNLDKSSGVIYASSHSDTVTLNVNPTRSYSENERLSIVIEARSVEPYKEEIKATFEYVVGKQGITYEIEDEANRPYLLFKVTNAITYCTVQEAFDSYNINDRIDINDYKNLSDLNKSKCVGEDIGISFDPNILRIDTTDNLINDSTYTTTDISNTLYINSLNFNVEPVSTVSIKFYKINPSINYTFPVENTTSIINVNY